MVGLTGADLVVFAAAPAGCDPFRAFAHRAFCAIAIFRREAADMIRFGLSASARRKIAAAQRARWAKLKKAA